MLLHNALAYLHIYDTNLTLTQIDRGIFDLCVRLTSSDVLMGAMWFCPALLLVSVFSAFAMKSAEKVMVRPFGGIKD